MRIRHGFRTLVVLAGFLSFIAAADAAPPEDLSGCAWPLETAGSGATNVAYPDKNATYWTMPLDRTLWRSMIIEGTYPSSRFFSFVSYEAKGASYDDIVDVDIMPDAGSRNPFVEPAGGAATRYTVTVGAGSGPNDIGLDTDPDDAALAWVIYRIYVPNEGLDRNAGVPLPAITLVGYDGSTKLLKACPSRKGNPSSVQGELRGSANGVLADFLAGLRASVDDPATCQPQDDVVFWIPEHTGGYFPNPANKYIAAPGLCFDSNKVVVVRGKAAGFPDTHAGNPLWQPAIPGVPIQLRYWSMCNNDQVIPYPVVECASDWATALDADGFYTYVLGDSPAGKAPRWLPAGTTWLPWGLKKQANILIFRNMLPADDFTPTVQGAALQPGCLVDNEQHQTVPRSDVERGGACAANYMGDYYPRAVYCDKRVLATQGWQACFAIAGKTARRVTGR
jgi:hypothetical protein